MFWSVLELNYKFCSFAFEFLAIANILTSKSLFWLPPMLLFTVTRGVAWICRLVLPRTCYQVLDVFILKPLLGAGALYYRPYFTMRFEIHFVPKMDIWILFI